MDNSFVLFDVFIVISREQFHCGIKVTLKHISSFFPVGKRSSGSETNIDITPTSHFLLGVPCNYNIVAYFYC